MNWTENWPTVLMLASVFLFIGALFGVMRFIRNASDRQDGQDWPAIEDVDEIDPERRPSTRGFIAVGLLAFMVAMALACVAFAHRPARDRVLPPDGVLWTPEALLRDFFPTSERVAYQLVSLTPEEQRNIAALAGVEREDSTQMLYVARTGTGIDGYAFLSETDPGEHPAAFGVQLSADGRVKRVEVTRLHDPEQQDVLDSKFLQQFEGCTFSDARGLHRRIERPFGCTAACSDTTQAVRRAVFLVSKIRANSSAEAASPISMERR